MVQAFDTDSQHDSMCETPGDLPCLFSTLPAVANTHCLRLSAATFAMQTCLQASEETLWPDSHLLEVSRPRCAWTAWKSSLVHKGWQPQWSR